MQDDSKFIVDSIQDILDGNNGFIALSKLPSLMSVELRDMLGIKKNAAVKILRLKLGSLLEDHFVLRKNGNALYLFTPCNPEDSVLAVMSEDKPITVKEIANALKQFAKGDVAAIVAELANSGRAIVAIDEKFTVRFLAAGSTARRTEPVRQEVVRHEEYTMEAMRRAYDELHKFREFVRICDVRRRLNWPREVFDEMIRTLRDDRTIRIMRADQSILTRDEVQDCFVDENNFIMGTMIWNVR